MELTLAEAAQLLGKTHRQIRYMIKTERLKARMAGTDRDLARGRTRSSGAR